MRHPLCHRAVPLLSLVTVLGLTACQSGGMFGGPDPNLEAVVALDEPGTGDEIMLDVVLPNKNYLAAAGKLRIEDWPEATRELKKLIVKETKPGPQAQAYFALGVAYEAQGDYEAAEDAYAAALERVNDFQNQESLGRVRKALDKDEADK